MVSQGQRVVVVADDDEAMRLLCRVNLELEGFRVVEAAGEAEVEELVEREHVVLVLLDVHLGRENGLEIARRMRERHPEVPVAFLTGSVHIGEQTAAVSDGAIRKPFALEELIETVHRLARR
ncbi:MAG TPA: response regulator [Gaiellaceae bacterium]|nr:response regulator [Gaiellaceae bacterium]